VDILVGYAELVGNYIAWGIEQATGWRPDDRAKTIIDWVGSITSAFLGLFGVIALVRGRGTATKLDIETLREEMQREFRAALASREAATAPRADSASPAADAGLSRDLDAAIDTLLSAGKANALKDKTGAAAEAAIDALIAERAAARKRVAKDEAALWRQKGAVAFLHDTQAAIRAYAMATELDPGDADGWNMLGQLQRRTGDLEAAVKSQSRILELGQTLADRHFIAVARCNLAINYFDLGNLSTAESMAIEALELHKADKNMDGLGHCYGILGRIYESGNPVMAEDMYRKAIYYADIVGDDETVAANQGNLGIVQMASGNPDEAEAMFRHSLATFNKLGHLEGVAHQIDNLATVFKARNEVGKACENWREAVRIFRELGVKREAERVNAAMCDAGCPET
jgi:tetratricopeptide (TPR) repeat protein